MRRKTIFAAAIFCVALAGCSRADNNAIITTESTSVKETSSVTETITTTGSRTVRGTFWGFIKDEEASIIKLSDMTVTALVIPTELEGYPITVIEPRAFMSHTNLVSVEWPETISMIDDQMFCGCTALTNIIIHEGVTSIGKAAFASCSRLESINLPNSLTTIEKGAFFNCQYLKSIIIPEGVTCIEGETFIDCLNLKNITIPASVTSIAEDAFVYEGSGNIIPEITIHTPKGSYAEEWAKQNGYEAVND